MTADLAAVTETLEIDPPSRAAFEAFLDAQLRDGLVERSVKRAVVDRLLVLDAPVPVGEATPASDPVVPSGSTQGREALAIAYVDHFVARYDAIPDELWELLHAEFDDAELTELSWTIAVVKGMLRVSAALGVDVPAIDGGVTGP